MPNILIYHHDPDKEAKAIKKRVEEILNPLGVLPETITTIIPCKPESCSGSHIWTPYIRVCDTNAKRIKKIILALKEGKISMDVEWLQLSGFASKEEMGG